MQKKIPLPEFHFDKEKSGRILNGWRNEIDMPIPALSVETGIPENTLKNSLYGKVQDLTMDRTFKICVALGRCPCEYIEEMLKDEPIDFADRIHVLRDPEKVKVPMFPTHDSTSLASSESVSGGLLDRFRRVYDTMLSQFRDQVQQLKDSREIMHQQYQQQLETMERQHVIHNTAMETHHAEAMQRADKEIDRLQLQNTRLRTALVIETSAIGILFFADALIGDRGWILRSLLDLGGKTGYITKG